PGGSPLLLRNLTHPTQPKSDLSPTRQAHGHRVGFSVHSLQVLYSFGSIFALVPLWPVVSDLYRVTLLDPLAQRRTSCDVRAIQQGNVTTWLVEK
ncbi:MAG: hypothetical protein WBC37_16980, partial [Burkholderiaceae bacterium]